MSTFTTTSTSTSKSSSPPTSSSTPIVRLASISDLPSIHELIKESFLAMGDYYPSLTEMFARGAESAFTPGGDNQTYHGKSFWVCEVNKNIVGCVGLKRTGDDDGELVRMSISSKLRGGGVGQKVFKTLEDFCISNNILDGLRSR